ncbi:hypothetical protein MPLSOD_20043 [Mesorhizobium sp. SOD10]|nr:hypothetical protein MPLSOD_20043 [Mesorhizobium sp. SOD10]
MGPDVGLTWVTGGSETERLTRTHTSHGAGRSYGTAKKRDARRRSRVERMSLPTHASPSGELWRH